MMRMHHLRKLGAVAVVAAAGIFGLAASAQADGPYRGGLKDAPCCDTWTGWYWGIHGGRARGEADWDFVSRVPGQTDRGTFVFDVDQSPRGLIVGTHSGYLWQSGPFVIGAEWSLSGGGVTDHAANKDTRTAADDHFRTTIDWLFLGTGKLGYSWSNCCGGRPLMTYVKGGWASAEVRLHTVDITNGTGTNGGNTHTSEQRHNGWTVGGGLDWALTKNVSFGIEYNYVNLEEKTHVQIWNPPGSVNVDNVDPSLHMVTLRLTYKFDECCGGRALK